MHNSLLSGTTVGREAEEKHYNEESRMNSNGRARYGRILKFTLGRVPDGRTIIVFSIRANNILVRIETCVAISKVENVLNYIL
jgi:hypothetical protein